MRSIWGRHLIFCLSLGLLAIPIYFLDQAIMGPTGGGGNWITLDFRGLIFWTYITFLAIEVVLSSTAVLLFPRLGALRIHVASLAVAPILLVAGFSVYGKLSRLEMARSYRAFMENRRRLLNVIELKDWWYFPDDIHPSEIHVSVVVHDSGRFAGNVTGSETDASGSSRIAFESTNEPERQRQVHGGEAFTYVFPLKIIDAAHADNVSITLYLFKAPSGPDLGDITKVFVSSPQKDDDGRYFYGRLPPPSQPRN
jgi:hypothetical protein